MMTDVCCSDNLERVSDPSSSDRLAPAPPLPDDPIAWSAGSLAGRPARLSVVVVRVLVEGIVSGRYPSGTLLPPEPVLCQAFDVSRSVVREALKALEEKGLARVRQGHGTTVTPPDEWNLLDPVVLEATIQADLTVQTLDDLVDVRVALESDMARAAALSISDDDLAELGVLLTELGTQLEDPARYLETDTRYHDFIMRCSGNRLGRSIIRAIHPHARASTRYNPPTDEEDIERAHRGHLEIFEHLRRRDGDGAAAAMHEHIRGTWELRKLKRV
jgi:DNA-binding FadR family transcriptional regulator